MNPREFELLNLLSAHETAGNTAAKPVKLAMTLAGDPTAPAITDLMTVAAQTADAAVVEKVTAYCKAHPEYSEMLEQFARFAKDEEIPEPPIEGSILARMKFGDFASRTYSTLGGQAFTSDYLPLREAARIKGVPVDDVQYAVAKGELTSDVRDGERRVSVQSLNIWNPRPRSRPVDALDNALAVSTGPESVAWLSRKLPDGSTLVVLPSAAVNLPGIKPGGSVRVDLPEIGTVDAYLRYADQDMVILVVANKVAGKVTSSKQTPTASVTVFSRGVVSAALLVTDGMIDRDGRTVSVVGAKTTIPGRRVKDMLLVRLGSGRLVPATLTHIHARHDRYRAAVVSSYVADEEVLDTRQFGSIAVGRVSVADPFATAATEVSK